MLFQSILRLEIELQQGSFAGAGPSISVTTHQSPGVSASVVAS